MLNLIGVQGNFQRLIKLETELETAYAYLTDFNHVLPRLPEVDRVLRYRDGRYRMIFSADDGRGHEMGVVFDIRHELVEHQHIKMISIPVSRQELSGDRMHKSKGPLFPGLFSGEVIFTERTDYIEITYRVDLLIEIEVPRFLNFMPHNVLQKLGDSLMQFKLHSIGDGFADKLASDFEGWQNLNIPGELQKAAKTAGQSRLIRGAD
ncbi:MAG TPA: DUF1997 domain-containing protein [Chloroflexia bacterium]|nr:DUF1997 domain-containing protein [Chloroflexia bacterium]